MGFEKVYRSLFNVELLHHYFLDEGKEVYGDDLDADKMAKNLSMYRVSNFMDIRPSKRTVKTLKNYRSRFIKSNHGFQVVTASEGDNPFIPFSQDLSFDFIVRITDQFFENYTNIIINRSEPLYLSNVTPDIPEELEEGEEKTAIPVSFCLLSEFETSLTKGSPLLTPPMVSREIELDEIESRELLGAFAVIRIHLNGEAGEITLTDVGNGGNGEEEFNVTLPEVVLMFENRTTTWKYHRSKDSVQVHETAGELPLTKHGYISVIDGDAKEYPNPSARMIYNGEDEMYKDTDDNLVVEDADKKYSRIFI